MYYVYIIQNTKSGRFYIGSTSSVNKRLKEHNKNQTKSTKHRGPWAVVYNKEFELKKDALDHEKQIKSYKGGRAFKKLIRVPVV